MSCSASRLESPTGWARRCPRCGELTRPSCGRVMLGTVLFLFYKCRCGRVWGDEIEDDTMVSEIGGSNPPRLPMRRRGVMV